MTEYNENSRLLERAKVPKYFPDSFYTSVGSYASSVVHFLLLVLCFSCSLVPLFSSNLIYQSGIPSDFAQDILWFFLWPMVETCAIITVRHCKDRKEAELAWKKPKAPVAFLKSVCKITTTIITMSLNAKKSSVGIFVLILEATFAYLYSAPKADQALEKKPSFEETRPGSLAETNSGGTTDEMRYGDALKVEFIY